MFVKSTSEDGKYVWWALNNDGRTVFYGAGMGGNVEATALASLALMQAKKEPATVRCALAWLVKNKGPGGLWYSTQASVLALQALLAGTSAPANEGERKFIVKMGEYLSELRIQPDQADVMQRIDLTPHLRPGNNRLIVKETSESAANYQLTFRYHVPETARVGSSSKELDIGLTYDRTSVSVGETVKATVQVSNRMRQDAAMVMVDLPVPAGFTPATEDFAALLSKGVIGRYQVNGRQVLVYLRGLPAGKPLELTYHLKAKSPVKIDGSRSAGV